MGAIATLGSAGDLLNTIPRTVRCPMNTCDIVRYVARKPECSSRYRLPDIPKYDSSSSSLASWSAASARM